MAATGMNVTVLLCHILYTNSTQRKIHRSSRATTKKKKLDMSLKSVRHFRMDSGVDFDWARHEYVLFGSPVFMFEVVVQLDSEP